METLTYALHSLYKPGNSRPFYFSFSSHETCNVDGGIISRLTRKSLCRKKSPGIEAIVRHPAFPGTIWNLEPRQSGLLPVAWDRGGPINISWEIHGHGKIKIVVSVRVLPIA